MAANFSVFMSEKILNNVFVDQVAVTTFATMYCALFHNSTGTTEANLRANTIINEITDSNYVRQSLTMTSGGSFNAAAADTVGMHTDTKNVITFPGASSAYPNSVTHVALLDSLTNGNIIMYASISATPVPSGEYIEIAVNNFDINL